MIDVYASICECMCTNSTTLPGAYKTQPDLDRYKAIFDRVQPDLIVETGTYQGYSALWFSRAAGCEVLTVDICPSIHADTLDAWNGEVHYIIGSSIDPRIINAITQAAQGAERTIVILDGSHHADDVYAEMVAYGPLVPRGSYMVVEDTLMRWVPWANHNGNPLDAVEKWLPEQNGAWELDAEIDDMFPTGQFPGGWLRRVI